VRRREGISEVMPVHQRVLRKSDHVT